MLEGLDDSRRTNPHYAGWAGHAYNDYLEGRRRLAKEQQERATSDRAGDGEQPR